MHVEIPHMPKVTVDLEFLRPTTLAAILADFDETSEAASSSEETIWNVLAVLIGPHKAAALVRGADRC